MSFASLVFIIITAPILSQGTVPPPEVETNLATSGEQIRQLAFDGDEATFFLAEKVGEDGRFALVFERPVAIKEVRVVTGKGDGADRLDAGTLEVSADGKEFESIGEFREGKATGRPKGPVKAVRIEAKGQGHPLAIREVVVEGDEAVDRFAYPVEFTVDVKDAPEMKEWAEGVARLCERWYSGIARELATEGYKPTRRVTMALTDEYEGVAAASGNRIVGSVAYFKSHPKDKGAMIHETVHIIQRYRSRKNPGWLVEGVADYIRFFEFEPGKAGRLDPEKARYDASYRTTAAFLAYLVGAHDKQIVPKLNRAMREGTYSEEIFKTLTGKDVKQLDADWRASLKR